MSSIMRQDMQHLLVERGHAFRDPGRKGWASRVRFRHGDPEDGDGWLPPRPRPQFSENLAPLYRYLAAQVGRPWDKVYSEIRARVEAGNAVQFHILQHLYDKVEVHVEIDENGTLWTIGYGGRHPLNPGYRQRRLYVCPRTGLLRRVKPLRPKSPPPRPVDRLPGDSPGHEFRKIAGQWYRVHMGRDPLTGDPLILHKQQLNRRRLRELGLRG
jgi:hypothetical protein